MNLQRFKQNLAANLVQARQQTKEGGEDLIGEKGPGDTLELNDLLKSFEEHTGYQAGVN